MTKSRKDRLRIPRSCRDDAWAGDLQAMGIMCRHAPLREQEFWASLYAGELEAFDAEYEAAVGYAKRRSHMRVVGTDEDPR